MGVFEDYKAYVKDNPQHYWFKRKLFGWGWTPVTWQGWAVVLLYLAGVFFFAFTIDENSPASEVAFTFLFPLALLTFSVVLIAYRKGEKPKWQWGLPRRQTNPSKKERDDSANQKAEGNK